MRTCGTCVACCVCLEIPEIDKPAFYPCFNLKTPPLTGEKSGSFCVDTRDNCSARIKPKRCITYKCEWLKGKGKEEDRPDRCGILIDTDIRQLWTKD